MIGFVVNPVSGNGRGRYVWEQIEEVLQNRRVPYSVRFTTGQQDAMQFAMEWAVATSKVTIIVAVGGDGTLHEVANGIYHVNVVTHATSAASDTSNASATSDASDASDASAASDAPDISATSSSYGTHNTYVTYDTCVTHATSATPHTSICSINKFPTKPLGHIPAGSGNDYARGHHIPLQPLLALELILSSSPNIRSIDLIRLNDRIALNSIGAGIDARIARETNEASYKKLFNQLKLGRLSYVLTLIRVLLTYQTCSVTLTLDGKQIIANKVWFITAANIPFYGGGMKICPQADPVSGQAEICIVSDISRLEFIRVFPQVYKGTHIHHKAISFYQGRRIKIEAERPLDVHMDGETAGTSPATAEILPAILSIIVP